MKWWISSATLLLLAALAALLYFRGPREDPGLTEVKAQLQQQMRDQFEKDAAEGKEPSPQEQRERFEQIRAKMDALPPAERAKAEEAGRAQMRAALQARLDELFALPASERPAEIDRMIDEQEANRKKWAALGAGPSGAPPGPSSSASGSSNASPGGATPGSPPAPGGGPPPGGPPGSGGRPPGGWSNATPEQRKEFQRRRVNDSTPEFRRQMAEYVRLVQDRRKERGLPPANMWELFGPRAAT